MGQLGTRKRIGWVATLALAMGLLSAAPAEAVIIRFDPLVSVVYEGDSFGVDVWVRGLHASDSDEIVAGFDLDVFFSGSILAATDFAFGSGLGPVDDTFYGFTSGAGFADIFQFNFLLSDDELAAMQGGTVRLGTLQFVALGAGITPLWFGDDPLFGRNIVGRDGLTLDPIFAIPAVTVVRRAVPEPGTVTLVGLSLLALAFCRPRLRHRRLRPSPRC